MPLDSYEDPNSPRFIPYVLVYPLSPSPKDCEIRTDTIPKTIKTELGLAISSELRALWTRLSESSGTIEKTHFLILDKNSTKDRKAVVIHESPEWVDLEGKIDEEGLRDDLRKRITWRRHWVPYEKVFEFMSMVCIQPGDEGEEYLEEVEREW